MIYYLLEVHKNNFISNLIINTTIFSYILAHSIHPPGRNTISNKISIYYNCQIYATNSSLSYY